MFWKKKEYDWRDDPMRCMSKEIYDLKQQVRELENTIKELAWSMNPDHKSSFCIYTSELLQGANSQEMKNIIAKADLMMNAEPLKHKITKLPYGEQ